MNIYLLSARCHKDFIDDVETNTSTNTLDKHCCENFMRALEALKYDEREFAQVYGRNCERAMVLRELIAELEDVK